MRKQRLKNRACLPKVTSADIISKSVCQDRQMAVLELRALKRPFLGSRYRRTVGWGFHTRV